MKRYKYKDYRNIEITLKETKKDCRGMNTIFGIYNHEILLAHITYTINQGGEVANVWYSDYCCCMSDYRFEIISFFDDLSENKDYLIEFCRNITQQTNQ